MLYFLSTEQRTAVCNSLLIESSKEGLTPLHQVLISGDLKRVTAYFEMVAHAVEKGVISKEAHEAVLLQLDKSKLTPLHLAANSGNEQVVSYVLKILNENLTQEKYTAALHAKLCGFKPSCQNESLDNAKKINELLDAERNTFPLAKNDSVYSNDRLFKKPNTVSEQSFIKELGEPDQNEQNRLNNND